MTALCFVHQVISPVSVISSYLNYRCNTDLGENDLEMTIVRGLQFNLPSGMWY